MITTELQLAQTSLEKGDIIGLPTETVYGLAGNAFDETAIKKIYAIKERPANNPLIVHVASIDQATQFIESFPAPLLKLAERFWPGPLTLLLEKTDQIPTIVTAGSNRVAIRIPNHPITLALLKNLSFPLVAPSANPYTRISPTRAEQVEEYFGDRIGPILQGGPCQQGLESTIVGMEDEQVVVYRLGALSVEQLEQVVGHVSLRNRSNTMQLAPGMAKKHYSPKTLLVLVDDIHRYQEEHPEQKIGVFLYGDESPETVAPTFYSRLQEMDKAGYEVLIAKSFPDTGLGRTLNDRLQRAAQY